MSAGEPALRATSAGVTKIPDPTIPPITIIVASNKPMRRARPGAAAGIGGPYHGRSDSLGRSETAGYVVLHAKPRRGIECIALCRRRRLHGEAAGGQPARCLPRCAQPLLRTDAAPGPRDELRGVGLRLAARKRSGCPDPHLHPRDRA